jgi:hypothetical protein
LVCDCTGHIYKRLCYYNYYQTGCMWADAM